MQVAEEIKIQAGTLQLAARAWGPSDASPVIALHGWLDNAASFDGLAPFLKNVRLIALDLPGHGFSEHLPPGCFYHYIDYLPRVLAAADALGWERFTLLGHSLGAGIATLLAGIVPERITRLALIEGLGPLSMSPAEAPKQFVKAMRAAKTMDRKRFPHYATRESAIEARKSGGHLSHSSAQTLVDRGLVALPNGFTWRSDPRLTLPSVMRLTEEQVLAFMSNISAPTFLIRADSGWPVTENFFEQRLACVSGARMETLSGYHHLHLDEPEPVAELLNGFLCE